MGDLRNSSTLSGNFQAEKFVEYNITVKSNQALSYGYGRLKRRFSKRRIVYYNNHKAFFQLELLSCGDIHPNPGQDVCINNDNNEERKRNRPSMSKISVFYSNARSIVNKIAKLQLELAKMQTDIVVLTETYLNDSISNEEILGTDYRVYRKDRSGKTARHGGGVLIAVKKSITALIREDLNCKAELLFIDMVLNDSRKLTIGVFYRPPSSDASPLEQLQSCITCINTSDVIIVGDFNLSDFDWTINQPTKISEQNVLLADIVHDNFLYQIVDQPTREKNILDLILTTNVDLISDLEVGEPFSDHNSIRFSLNTRPYENRTSKKKVYAFNKADWTHLKTLLAKSSWDLALAEEDINRNWENWKDLYFAAVDECVPKYRQKRKLSAPWISKELIKLCWKKKNLYKKAKRSNNKEHWAAYRNLNNSLKRKCNFENYS